MHLRRKIFEYIADQQSRWNYVPRRSEIHKMFGAFSDDLDLHLEQLAREGMLFLPVDGGEEISLPPTFLQAPILKLHGSPLSGRDQLMNAAVAGTISLDLRGIGIDLEPNMYAMIVPDDSMIDGGVLKGDIAIMSRVCPQRGDIVETEANGRAALRRLVIIQTIPHFLAENPCQPELIHAFELPMHGVLWGLIRMNLGRRRIVKRTATPLSYSDPTTSISQRGLSSVGLQPTCGRAGDKKEGSSSQRKKRVDGRRVVKLSASQGHPFAPRSEWPKPPSGIELNDETSPEYGHGSKLLDDDAPKYGWALEEALNNYENKEKERRRRL